MEQWNKNGTMEHSKDVNGANNRRRRRGGRVVVGIRDVGDDRRPPRLCGAARRRDASTPGRGVAGSRGSQSSGRQNTNNFDNNRQTLLGRHLN